jgi:crotonobetainyl-CoA:carnitine CoA-transferase CaiB-like acyl-CoA transferase
MNRSAMERAATLAGLTLAPDTDLTITGEDPILATPLHVAEGVSVALGLVGQAANGVWVQRGRRPQALSVDARHAIASLHSYALLELDGRRPADERPVSNVTDIYRCGDDRYIHLHSSFTHGPGTLEELGLGDGASVEEIAAATSKRGAFDLEDALAAKGLCCAACRTIEEWAAHPQGALLATKPVVEITKIGDAPPEPFPDGERPLTGVRVLDLTRVLAGPTSARTLAEHGADVLHIASPNLPTTEALEMDTGHGKRQAFIDLTKPAEADALRELVRGTDVFSQGFQHGSLARRGFGASELAKLRPGIVYVSENAFGHEGPWQERPGWEQLAQSTTGVAVTNGIGRPQRVPVAMNDYTTGYLAAYGAMTALERRAREGGSWLVRVSLSQTSMWYLRLGLDVDRAAATGEGDATPFMQERETPYGRMRHLRPPLQMSETPPCWTLPTSPIGSGPAAWL